MEARTTSHVTGHEIRDGTRIGAGSTEGKGWVPGGGGFPSVIIRNEGSAAGHTDLRAVWRDVQASLLATLLSLAGYQRPHMDGYAHSRGSCSILLPANHLSQRA